MKIILFFVFLACLVSFTILYLRNNYLLAKGLKTNNLLNILMILLVFIGMCVIGAMELFK